MLTSQRTPTILDLCSAVGSVFLAALRVLEQGGHHQYCFSRHLKTDDRVFAFENDKFVRVCIEINLLK